MPGLCLRGCLSFDLTGTLLSIFSFNKTFSRLAYFKVQLLFSSIFYHYYYMKIYFREIVLEIYHVKTSAKHEMRCFVREITMFTLKRNRFLRDLFVAKAMANLSCPFASHFDSHCDISSRGNELLPLSSCSRDVSAHLRQISVSHKSVTSEKELILARVRLFDESGRDFTICPKHRDKLGVKFNASIKCQHPLHGNRKGKRERGVNLRMSKKIKSK